MAKIGVDPDNDLLELFSGLSYKTQIPFQIAIRIICGLMRISKRFTRAKSLQCWISPEAGNSSVFGSKSGRHPGWLWRGLAKALTKKAKLRLANWVGYEL